MYRNILYDAHFIFNILCICWSKQKISHTGEFVAIHATSAYRSKRFIASLIRSFITR